MSETNVPLPVLDRLAVDLPDLSPEARKAATYVLENPSDVGVSTVREIAVAANVKPNTLVRLARRMGFNGYDDFREPFREAIRNGPPAFETRAQWLQDTRSQGRLGDLYADMVQSALHNIEDSFAATSPEDMAAAGEAVWQAKSVYTLGVGVNNSNARSFTYLASTGMVDFHTIPRPGNTATDDLAFASKGDVLIAITCKPYRSEVVDAVHVAKDQGLTIVGISDSPASPILTVADHSFVMASETPQFFPSSVSTVAVLETLLSFVIAAATPAVVKRVERFHSRRYELGIYEQDPET